MSIKQEFRDTKEKFRLLSLYQRFEHLVIMFLTVLYPRLDVLHCNARGLRGKTMLPPSGKMKGLSSPLC